MALSPIAFIAPNYRDFKTYWLKAYEAGTTTPKLMSLDSIGSVTVAKLQLNADGFIVSAGDALVIPYIDDSYDLWLFPTEDEADNNDTSNAERLADDITGVNGVGANSANVKSFSVLQDAVDSTDVTRIFNGAALNLAERTTDNGGGAMWDVVLASTVAPNTFNIVQCVGAPTLALILRTKDGEVFARQFGVIANDISKATQNDAALVAFETFCTTNELLAIFDANGDTFHVTQDVNLPLYTDGLAVDNLPTPAERVFHFTGAPNVIYDHTSQGKCFNISAETDITFMQGQFHEVNNILAEGHIILDPAPFGIFWCNFTNLRGLLIFDLSTSGINQNVFTNINPHSFDINDWALLITDGSRVSDFKECHANTFINFDVSRTKGVNNQSNLNQLNQIVGFYAEGQNGTAITENSNFDVKGMNFDGLGALAVSLENEVTGVTGHSERTGGNFTTIPSNNLCIGGEWDIVDASKKPACFGGAGSNSVIVDANAPFGSGRLWGNETSDDFSTVSITVPPILTSDTLRKRFSLTGIWLGDLPLALTVGASSYDVATSFTSLGSEFFILRITGFGDAVSDTVIDLFITQASSGTRKGFLGNVWCSATKTSIIPTSPEKRTSVIGGYSVIGGEYVESGRSDTGFQSSSPLTKSIIFDAPYTLEPKVQVSAEAIGVFSEDRFTKILVKNLTTTGMDILVYFVTDFTGRVHWDVKGV